MKRSSRALLKLSALLSFSVHADLSEVDAKAIYARVLTLDWAYSTSDDGGGPPPGRDRSSWARIW